MNYRSLNDLNRTVVEGLWKLPSDIRLVAGIPRSGMLVANLIALYLDLPLTDTKGLIEGRLMASGFRSKDADVREMPPKGSRVLVVDDSTHTGQEMRRQRQLLAPLGDRFSLHFLAAYGLDGKHAADQILEVVSVPRAFEWNIMHLAAIEHGCVDIDGVLCRDPTDEENDDGELYREFIAKAEPRWKSSRTIGWLVTSRLEKYRALTVEWLERHGVSYKKLVMVDLPDKKARDRLHNHSRYKGRFFRSVRSSLFIESSAHQAREIARISGKSVWCIEDRQMYGPGGMAAASAALMEPRMTSRRGMRFL